jgi:isoleucyl-tRNA synthetase
MDQHGADAVRWYMLAAGSPWSARRVGHDALSDVVRKTLLTYWNTVSFFTLYAKASNFNLESQVENPSATMDRWILSELHSLTEKVEKAYENFDSQESGRLLAQFIDDLSNWYVRRSRRRFWDGDESALSTLYTSLKVLTQLLAPMVPFITEHVWQELVRIAEPGEPESVHLAQFPISDRSRIDQKLSTSVALSRRLVELGRAARAESKIKIRQPLARALVSAKGWDSMDLEIRSHITEELNVLVMDELSTAGGDLVEISIKANFRTIGTRYGADVQAIAAAISGANATNLVKKLRAEGKAKISYTKAGAEHQAEIDLDDLVVTETPKSGWSVSSHSGESVALDLELTPELIQAGLVREIIRAIQEERKNSGFDISDRIIVTWNGTAATEKAIESAVTLIGDEVLATSFNQDTSLAITDNEIGIALKLSKA